jgi:maltose alpha-D-glucosyltransferase/alpha-amylase
MRKEVPEIGWGDFTVIPAGDPAVLVMRYDWRNNSVLFVHNLDGKPREVAFSVGLTGENAPQGRMLVNLLSEDHSHAGEDGRHLLVIEPYGYRWYRVGGLDYLLRRSEIDDSEATPEASTRQPRRPRGGGRGTSRRRRRAAAKKSRR